MRTIRRGGEYLRLADPNWDDQLDGRFAKRHGGRWNPPGSFPVVYLNGSVEVARANLYRKLAQQPYGPEDLRPETAPILVSTAVSDDRYLDVISDKGCKAAGLPITYPRAKDGGEVAWDRCQEIGAAAWEAGMPGVACRSAAAASPGAEELAWFQRDPRRHLHPGTTLPFDEWFWEKPKS